MSTTVTGGSNGDAEFLVGAEDIRKVATTSASTGTNIDPYGIQYVPSTSAGSSAVYTLDPPIPGVSVTLYGSTDGPVYVKTANSETIIGGTLGSSATTVKGSSLGFAFTLTGLTTAKWAATFGGSTGMFTLSTST
jgi:hypothetical protein